MVVHGPQSEGFPVDDALVRRIEAIARAIGETPAEVLRCAVERFEDTTASRAVAPGTPFERAQRAGLIGAIKNAPSDLSTNRAHFNGFGGG